MDYVRSCYSTTMWAFTPGVVKATAFPVTWFFADPIARPLGIRHQYSSANWQRGTDFPDQVGERIHEPRPWSNGHEPPGYAGINFCGAPSLWQGKLLLLNTPMGSHPDGSPICCSAVPVVCANCTGGIGSSQFTVTLTGGNLTFAEFNGVWPITSMGVCFWQIPTSFGDVKIVVDSLGMLLTVEDFTTHNFVQYRSSTHDCFNPVGPWSVVAFLGKGTKPSVLVTAP